MKFIEFIALVLLTVCDTEAAPEHQFEARAPTCIADNCARAVTGTRTNVSPSTRTNDCNSFLGTYVFSTSAQPASTQTNTFIPTYAASYCDSARYSSACSCLGATRTLSTVVVATPTCTGGFYGDFCGNRWQRLCGMALVDSTFGSQGQNVRSDPAESDFDQCGGNYSPCDALSYNIITGQTVYVAKPLHLRADPDSIAYIIQEPRLGCGD